MGLTRPRAYQIFDIDYKQSVRAVSTSNVTLAGGAPATVDGISLNLNDRVLVTGQSTGSENGLYYVTTVGGGSNGTWQRSVDGNETGEIESGMIVMVTEGSQYADTQWKLTTDGVITIGTTALTFVINTSSVVGGSTTQVQFNDGGVLAGSAGFTFDKTANALSVTGNITGSNLSVSTGSVTLGSIVNANANGVGNIGNATSYFNTVFAKATSAQYADVAEFYCADADYSIGTVLEFGGNQEVTAAASSHTTAIAGTVSEAPAVIMNSGLDHEHKTAVALLGRVPCRVVGSIQKGDRLAASHLPGVATALDSAQYEPGCIIGKALENYNGDTEGIIEIVVGRL